MSVMKSVITLNKECKDYPMYVGSFFKNLDQQDELTDKVSRFFERYEEDKFYGIKEEVETFVKKAKVEP
jgi:hypothetical protein